MSFTHIPSQISASRPDSQYLDPYREVGKVCLTLYISISMCLLFVLFLLAASRKSTNTGKYRLLKKRNPFYFSAYFFYFSAYFVYFSAYFLPVLFFLTFSIGVT